MGARMQRRACSRVCGASTAKRPTAQGYAGAGPALKPYRAPPSSFCMTFRRRSGRTYRRDNSKKSWLGKQLLWEPVSHYTMKDLIPTERIEQAIFLIRGQKVLLDADLALIYGVPTKVLNQAVKRNLRRFPSDFVFRLTAEELEAIQSQIAAGANRAQIVTASQKQRKPRLLPSDFTALWAFV